MVVHVTTDSGRNIGSDSVTCSPLRADAANGGSPRSVVFILQSNRDSEEVLHDRTYRRLGDPVPSSKAARIPLSSDVF